jgi:hypothetical protein
MAQPHTMITNGVRHPAVESPRWSISIEAMQIS